MKNLNRNLSTKVAVTLTFVFSSLILYSQDIIVLKSGKSIQVEIIEVNDSEISYYELPKTNLSQKIKLHKMFIDRFEIESQEETISSEENKSGLNENKNVLYEDEDEDEVEVEVDKVISPEEEQKEMEMQKIYNDMSLFNNKDKTNSKVSSRLKQYAIKSNPLHLLKSDLKIGVEWPIHRYRSVEIEAGIRSQSNIISESKNFGFLNFTARSKYFMENANPVDKEILKIPEGLYYAVLVNGGTAESTIEEVGFYAYAGIDIGLQIRKGHFLFDMFAGPGIGITSYSENYTFPLTNSYLGLDDYFALRGGFRFGYVL